MVDQAALDEVFPNNPLREVAFEIRFPMNLRVLRDVCEVQEELGREYAGVGREEVQSPNTPTAINYAFSNATLGRIVKVWEDRFAIIFTRYETFERFKAEVIGRAQRFCEMFRIERLTRVGLRYH